MPSYDFYTDEYRGNLIDAESFLRLDARAEDIFAFLEREYTVTCDERARKKAVCALAEAIQATEQAATAALSSVAGESIGSVSVSYQKASAAEAGLDLSENATQRRYYDIARRYVNIHRGVR